MNFVRSFLKSVYRQSKLLLRRFLSSWEKPDESVPIVPVHLFQGNARHSGLPLQAAWAGNDEKHRQLWLIQLYSDFQHLNSDLVPLPKLKNKLKKTEILIAEKGLTHSGFPDLSFQLIVPKFIETYIDISEPFEIIKKRNSKYFRELGRMIRKYDYSYETDNSTGSQQDFYYNYYLPYLENHHADRIPLVSFEGVFAPGRIFDLYFINKQDEAVAGGLVHYEGNKAVFGFLGIRDGNVNLVREGVLIALYYFLIIEMHKKGYPILRLGGSPAWINHGLTHFKIRMTARIDKEYTYPDSELLRLFILRKTQAVRHFLASSPMVFLRPSGEAAGAIWLANGFFKSPDEILQAIRLFKRFDISDIRLIELEKNAIPEKWLINFQSEGFEYFPVEKMASAYL